LVGIVGAEKSLWTVEGGSSVEAVAGGGMVSVEED